MNRSRYVWQRIIQLLLIVALITTALPAYSAQAQDQNVVLSKAELGQKLWVTSWLQHNSSIDQRIKVAIASRYMRELNDAGGYSKDETVKLVNEALVDYEREVEQGQGENEYGERRWIDIALSGLKPVLQTAMGGQGGGLVDFVRDLFKSSNMDTDEANRLAALNKTYENRQQFEEKIDTELEMAVKLAAIDPKFADVWNTVFKPQTRIDKASNMEQVVQENPTVLPETIRERIVYRTDGKVLIAIKDLKEAVIEQNDLIHQVIDDQTDLADRIDHLQSSFNDYVTNQEKQRATQQMQQAVAQIDAMKLQAASSGIFVLSSLIGISDPKLGKQISVVGNSGIQIAQSIMNFNSSMTQLGKVLSGDNLKLATDLSSAILTGNIIGAILPLISLFQDSGPSDEQMILQQIGELRQQVEGVRQEMHSRFDRVDKEINHVYSAMMEQFTLVNLSQWEIRTDIGNIQTKLVDMEMDLHAVESQMNEWLHDSANIDLYNSISYMIGYQDRFATPIDAQTYYQYQNTFFHWATEEAKNSINAGPSNLVQDEYIDPERILTHLSQPLDQRLSYLNNWLIVHGLPPFTTVRLANPQIWTMSARAYAEVKVDWPQYAKLHDTNHIEFAQIQQVGQDLNNAVRAVTTVQTPNGPRGNRALFNGLNDYYLARTDELDNQLKDIEDQYVQDLLITSLKHPSNLLDFWLGPNQSIDYHPDGLWCDSSGTVEPSTLVKWIPAPYLVNNYLTPQADREQGTAKLDACFSASWKDERMVLTPKGFEKYYAKPQVEVDVRYEGTSIYTRYYEGSEDQDGTCDPEGVCQFVDPNQFAFVNWTNGHNFKSLMESVSSELPPSDQQAQDRAALLAQVTTHANQTLRDHQKAIYQSISNALGIGTPQRAAVRTLEVGKEVLSALISFGMPHVLESDDYLRSFLNGNYLNQIFGEETVGNWYLAAILSVQMDEGQTLTQDQQDLVHWFRKSYRDRALSINPRYILKQEEATGIDALMRHLAQYFDLIEAGKYHDSEPMVDTTLLMLNIADTISHLDLSTPTPTATPIATTTVTTIVTTTATPIPTTTQTPTPTQTPLPTQTPTPNRDTSGSSALGQIMPETGGHLTFTKGMQITMLFPAGTYSQPITVSLELLDSPPTPAGRLLGRVFSIVAFDQKHQPVTHFAKPYTLQFHYSDSDVAGLDEGRLSLHYWRDEKWVSVPIQVDPLANSLTATLDHLTIFAIFEDRAQVYLPMVSHGGAPVRQASLVSTAHTSVYLPIIQP